MQKVRYFIKKRKVLVFSLISILLVLLLLLTTMVSYLARPVSTSRGNILEYYNQPRNSLDMVVVGSSTTYRSWIPLYAWKNNRISSFSLAGAALPPSMTKYYIEEALKTQSPDFILIDVYSFIRRDTGWIYDEIKLAEYSSYLEYSKTRFDMLNQYAEIEMNEKCDWKYQFDLVINWKNLKNLNKKSWIYFSGDVNGYKGFDFRIDHKRYKDLQYNVKAESDSTPLTNETEMILDDLISYCKIKNLNVLFICNPFIITPEQKRVSNSVEKQIVSNGFDFIDANEYYDEIGINFSEDFYNMEHMNILGAEKYTRFLSR